MKHDANLLPSDDGNDLAATGRSQDRGGRLRRAPGHLAERPGGGGPSGLPGWSDLRAYQALRRRLGRARAERIASAARRGHVHPAPGHCYADLARAEESCGSLPLRGSRSFVPPGQVEALSWPQQRLLSAMQRFHERWFERPHRLSRWLIDRSFDRTTTDGSGKGWPMPWHRSALLWFGAVLLIKPYRAGLLWITAVHECAAAYTS